MKKRKRLIKITGVLIAVAFVINTGMVGVPRDVEAHGNESTGLFSDVSDATDDTAEEWSYSEIFNKNDFQNLQLKDQYALIDVPNEYIIDVSDEKLIMYVVNFPYLVDAFAYDNPKQGVNHVCKICSALAELLKKDNAETLIYDALNNLQKYISEDNVQGEYAASVAETFLRTLIEVKFDSQEKSAFTETRSLVSVTRKFAGTNGTFYNTTYYNSGTYTLNGVSVNCNNYSSGDLTSTQKQQVNTAFENTHSSWTRLQSASTKYNCHSYAFYSTASGNSYWISNPSAIYNSLYYLVGSGVVNPHVGDKAVLRGSYVYDEFGVYHNAIHSANVISAGYSPTAIQTESKLGALGTYRTSLSNLISMYGSTSYDIYRWN